MAEHDTLAAALVAALSELTGVAKTRTAKIPTKNGKDYSYTFANLEDVVEQTRPVLAKHGLVAMQPPCSTDQGMGIRTVILHASGETLDAGTLPFRSAGDPQRDGSAITYYRRYALLSALGMSAEDDDGTATRPENAAPPEPTPVGLSNVDAFAKIVEHLENQGTADPEGGHAKEVWRLAHPKAAGDGLIYESEIARLIETATEYTANLAAADA